MTARTLHRMVGLTTLSCVLGHSLRAQARPAPTITLTKGATEVAEPFSKLQGLVELRDGRVVVLEVQDKELRLVDVTRGTMSKVGRLGGGPLEYRVPGALIPGASDTVAYYDAIQHRFLLLSPGGAPMRTVTFGVADPAARLGQMLPAAADAAGRIYGQTLGMKMPPVDKHTNSLDMTFDDSVSIQAFDRATGQTKAIAKIGNVIGQTSPKVDMTGGTIKMTMTAPDFRASDVWTVLPDGRLVVMRGGVYRTHFIVPGRGETLGPLLTTSLVPVTAGEKGVVMDSLRKEMSKQMANMQNTVGSAAASAGVDVSTIKIPKFDMQLTEPAHWAATKPAYTALQSSPDGRLWVALSVPAGSKSRRYDLLDGTGALLAHVAFAPGEFPVGFGRNTVYTIRTDQDDLQYLRRYTLPRLP